MKTTSIILVTLILLAGCGGSNSEGDKTPESNVYLSGPAEVLNTWPGDYPVSALDRLPEGQREAGMGFLGDSKTFAAVWEALQPGEDVPEVDFATSIVIFVRNTQYFNRINVGAVNVQGGVAEVVAMETLSAAPIRDVVAMALVQIEREGIKALRVGDGMVGFE